MTIDGINPPLPVPVAPVMFPSRTLTQVTPFTYRDNLTYLDILRVLQEKMNEVISGYDDQNFNMTTFVNDVKKFIDDTLVEYNGVIDASIIQAAASAAAAEAFAEMARDALIDSEGFVNGVVGPQLDAIQDDVDNRVVKDTVAVNVKDHGAVGDGETDDTAAFESAISAARAGAAHVFVPVGRYVITEGVDVSGVDIRGEVRGYRSSLGSVLVGATGSGAMFVQSQTTASMITMNFANLRFENVETALSLTYSVYSTFSDLSIMCTGTGIRLGSSTFLGPLFNQFDRVQVISTSEAVPAFILGGKEWSNNNIFTNCFFRSGYVGFLIEVVGGYGAINNLFYGTEFAGDRIGFMNTGAVVGTAFENCYFENKGPAIWIAGSSQDLRVVGSVFGTLVNDNPTGIASYVHHASGAVRAAFDGGWITTGIGSTFDNLQFLSSAAPASFSFQFQRTPSTGSVAATGFRLFDPATMSETERAFYGDIVGQRHAAPKVILRYPDLSHPFEIRRNGTASGDDYGVQFRNNGSTALTIDNYNRVILGGQLILNNVETDVDTPGTVKGRWAVRTNTGALIGYIPIYDAID